MSCSIEKTNNSFFAIDDALRTFNGLTFSVNDESWLGHNRKIVIIGNKESGNAADFLFRRENIRFMASDEMIVCHESGSSVATAFASGLAGLLVYCNRLVVEKDHLCRLRMRDRIIQAFRVMIPHGADDFFGKRFKYLLSPDNETQEKVLSVVIPDQKWNETSKKALSKLIKELGVVGDP